MNEYVAFLLQELSGAEGCSEDDRRKIYERVRNELAGKLKQSAVRKTDVEVAGEHRALERAIGMVEDDFQNARLIPSDAGSVEPAPSDLDAFSVDGVHGMARDISAECLRTIEAPRAPDAAGRRPGLAGLVRTMWKQANAR